LSYDLLLVRVRGKVDAAQLAQAFLEDEGDDPNAGPIDPAAEAWKQKLVGALRAANPAFEPFAFDHAEIARTRGTSVDEARRQWRHVELNGPDDSNGIQITIHDDHANLTVPYWHRDAAARDTWAEIWKYLQALERAGELRSYDPQLEKVLDLDRDLDAVMAMYAKGVAVTRQAAEAAAAPPKKPWWRVW
jgi:hypothetical protein